VQKESDDLNVLQLKDDKETIKKALECCGSFELDCCDRCPLNWLEDHGEDCKGVLAYCANEWIEELLK